MPTQTTDTAVTISFTTINETWFIAPWVTASGGASTSFAGSTIANHGNLYTSNAPGVFVSGGGGGDIFNENGGVIGGTQAIHYAGAAGIEIVNRGEIYGTVYGVFSAGSGTAAINNSGDIFGAGGGLRFEGGNHSEISVTNSGLIESFNQVGILLSLSGAATAKIVNTGTVKGVIASIFAANGDRIDVLNSGTLIGDIAASSMNAIDRITNNGKINGSVFLGTGVDNYKGTGSVTGTVEGQDGKDILSGGNLVDRFSGGAGDDRLSSFGGNDVLNGGVNNDQLTGGRGRDFLTGGTGSDIFRFTSSVHSVVAALGSDRILDFDDAGTGDRIDVSALFGPAMTYRHNLAFTAEGQVRINDVAGADVIVEINTRGSLAADFAVRLVATTLASMSKGDFIL